MAERQFEALGASSSRRDRRRGVTTIGRGGRLLAVAVAALVGSGAGLASAAFGGSGGDSGSVDLVASPTPTSVGPGDVGGPSDGQTPPSGLGRVDGIVVDEAGVGLAYCFVDREALTPAWDTDEAIFSGADGSFSIGLAPGEWILKVTCHANGATGQSDRLAVPDQGIVRVTIVVPGGISGPPLQGDSSNTAPGGAEDRDVRGAASGSTTQQTAASQTSPAPQAPADALPPSGDQAPPASTGLVKPIKAKASITAKLSGRMLSVTVRAKGAKAPSGSKLIHVKAGTKVVTAKLNHGKAKVRVPKVKVGTKVKVTFVGTTGIKSATKLVTYRPA